VYHGMYEYRDEWKKVYHLSARLGGFKTVEAAVKAVVVRGGVGYVSDARNVPLYVVRNGLLKGY
jgi:hypothetical protein